MESGHWAASGAGARRRPSQQAPPACSTLAAAWRRRSCWLRLPCRGHPRGGIPVAASTSLTLSPFLKTQRTKPRRGPRPPPRQSARGPGGPGRTISVFGRARRPSCSSFSGANFLAAAGCRPDIQPGGAARPFLPAGGRHVGLRVGAAGDTRPPRPGALPRLLGG